MRLTAQVVRAARIAAQHLDARLPAGTEVIAAAPGLRDTPAGTFHDALAARTDGSGRQLAPSGGVSRRLDAAETGLVAIWGPRGAPYVVAKADLAIFTRGALPVDEASARAFAPSAAKALGPHGITLLDAFGQVERAMRAAVADGPVERDAMHQQLREALPGELLWACKGCGTDHVHPMVWRGACTMGSVRRDDASPSRAVTYASVASPPDPAGDAPARAEITRRALRYHGPLTLVEVATWLAVSPADVRVRLDAIVAELEEVDREGEQAWALAADLELLAEPPAPHGVRLLAAGDPLLDGRDRASLIPDPALRKEVWKALASPGVVLADGELVGTWRAKVRGGHLEVALTPLGGAQLPAAERLAPEADALAAARGLASATIVRAEPPGMPRQTI